MTSLPTPPFPMHGEFLWLPLWEELVKAGYSLEYQTVIIDNGSYPDDPDSFAKCSFIISPNGQEFSAFGPALLSFYGEAKTAELFLEWNKEFEFFLQCDRGFRALVYGNILDKVDTSEIQIPENLEWFPYEEYMEAALVDSPDCKQGRIIVRFPPSKAENNRIHTHPESDRRITVLSGSGEFVFYSHKNEKILVRELVPGDRVWMPRQTLHTFRSGGKGMVVESIHNPFIPFEDERCIAYPELEDSNERRMA